MDTRKLIKLLMLTTSDNDNEALIALRMANRLLKTHDKSWEDLLTRQRATSENSQFDQRSQDALSMLQFISEYAPAWFDRAFTDSLQEQLYRKRSLSKKQMDSLVKIYNMIRKNT